MIDRNDNAPMTPDAAGEGSRYWRSLDELANAAAFQESHRDEFPRGAADMASPFTRRSFLGLMAASAALAGSLTGCRRPEVAALPYSKAPERLLPGVPEHYATAIERAGEPIGVIVTCHEGRPIKIEGNPDHPASLGAVDPITQSLILELYDPDRSQTVLKGDAPASLEDFTAFADSHFKVLKSKQGEGLAFLAERTTSPTLLAQRDRILKAFPKAAWCVWEPFNDQKMRGGFSGAVEGEPMLPVYDFGKADLILALDADFLTYGPQRLAAARAFAGRRQPGQHGESPNRLYAVEPVLSLTGAAADHRLTLPASRMLKFAWALASRLTDLFPKADETGLDPKWLDALAADIKARKGRAILVAGQDQPVEVHAIATALNIQYGGECVRYAPADAHPGVTSGSIGLGALVKAMHAGQVDTLVILGGNPVFDTPSEFRHDSSPTPDFATSLKSVKTTIHLSLYANETSKRCVWHIPRAHALESWGDTRTLDGVVALTQPMLAPLYGGLTDTELLALLAGEPQRRAYDILRAYYQATQPAGFFENGWRKALHDGVLAPGAQAQHIDPARIKPTVAKFCALDPDPKPEVSANQFELLVRPHPYIYDGRYANNAWLQETPEPLTKLSWDNAALMAPAAAARLGLKSEDAVKLEVQGVSAELPVWIVPGMDESTILVYAGYGRTAAGRVGDRKGVNVYPLRSHLSFISVRSAKLTPTGRRMALATMQIFGQTGGRPLVREVNVAEISAQAHSAAHAEESEQESEAEAQLWRHPLDPEQPEQWAMAIDLSKCIGCHACVLACQAENNVPVVGKTQIAKGRIMQWLRIDRYFNGSAERPDSVVFQPMPCQQCETAPCEQVCPVAATSHSPEGLNDMAYNRCVGTRYCSNNCPFKVRRFNFFNYRKGMTPVEKMAMNPDVTVRMRGVMEKCTYCVQRIIRARVAAKAEGRPVRDGEVLTACQQACPTGAIIFGNQADPASRIAAHKRDPRNYVLLEDINLRPRTSYLSRLRNPNPALNEIASVSDNPQSAIRNPHSDNPQLQERKS